ncbi:MAG: hypothetical protein LUC37_05750, partial [Prevotella sp.]|nr:hypothetical protein [Prevotella sp.]
HKNTKYSSTIDRTNLIESTDPQSATENFMLNFGNLKKNTINYIQEIDIDGTKIGEPIYPAEDESEGNKDGKNS